MRRRIYKINKEDLDYIIINNLKWYKEPLRVAGYGELTYTSGGKTYYYYTFAQAQQAASSIGKRIPTQAEYSALGNLGFSWDVSLKGIWLGLDANEKQESKTSLFFTGIRKCTFWGGRKFWFTWNLLVVNYGTNLSL